MSVLDGPAQETGTLVKPHAPSNKVHLSENKRKVLERLRRGDGAGSRQQLVIPRRPPNEPIPLSFPQLQVWLHSQMETDVPFYNESITFYHHGPLSPSVLERCLHEIVRRHEIWRTTFELRDGEPVQIVNPPPAVFALQMMDLSGLPEAERSAEALRVATDNARLPFDLNKGPLLRALLVRLADEDNRLYMTFHQIIFDGVTAQRVFLPELASLYRAFSAGVPSPLPEPSIQYGDFAHWQRKTVPAGVWEQRLAFWRSRLSGELPLLELPTTGVRPNMETHRGEVLRFSWANALVDRLRDLSEQQGVSPYMTLLASFATLLFRYTGQEDLIIGGLSAGRNHADTELLPGFFVNPLAFRIDLSGNPTFREALARVREVVLEGLSHEGLPFAEVVKDIQPKSDPNQHPIFQVLLSQQPRDSAVPPGWNWVIEEVSSGGSKMDMFVIFDDRGDCLTGSCTYNPDLFHASMIARTVHNWHTLLTAIAADPDQSIADLPILTADEQRQCLAEWNQTEAEYPRKCLQKLIEAQVQRTPEATAIMLEEERLSYGELNACANQLAHYLRKLGVGPEDLVGVCMGRSAKMMVALLAILKAGGAYVPLDPLYPEERLAFMIKDSGLRFLFTDEPWRTKLSDQVLRVVHIDKDWPIISREARENPPIQTGPENLAYVIYTSGSTGVPKGIQICHSSLVNLLTSMRTCPGLTEKDSVLAVTTISFDIAALELYLPLMVGARCVLASREASADGQRLSNMLDRYQITVMQATPSTWKLLLESGWPGKSDLKILCGGEAMPRELAEQLIGRARSVWNMYGPTETTVWSSVYQVTSCAGSIPIGRPIENTQIYVLDRNMYPVPVGVIGELYIGGDGLARGYLNSPKLNAEKFIPDPFHSQTGARLYKTGDLARYREDGNIECLRRVDNQVKIRGFRIELSEIESVLRKHPTVGDACVIVREDTSGDLRLVAYIVPSNGQLCSLEVLRQWVKEKVPSYMVPMLVSLEKLPLTPNGKIDRRALPAPAQDELRDEQSFEEPREPIEEALASIWTDVLKVPRVSVYDNFIDLGGHSLLALQVTDRLEKKLGIRMKPSELAFQTLGQLAASCKERLTYQ
ncbi:MAG TPA: amino acid adenylation domain-containing protein [Candidatus Acidoferrum sp.]|nr:amino acid adenylation domain-containing protein [Candidatus Acidoferrum sp.]